MRQDRRAIPVLMMVHAHPDDESSLTGGTLARYSAAGCRTVLITCTDGGQGDTADGLKPGQPGHDPRLVAAARSGELDQAASALGVHDVVKLGYPDSGTGTQDAAAGDDLVFSRRPLRPMLIRMVRLMRLYRPDVLVTYPPNGLSGHPDHVRTHELVTAAHHHLIANAKPDDTTDRPRQPSTLGPKLYHIALSRTRLRGVQDRARTVLGLDAWVPPDAMAIADADITTAIDVTAFWPDKLRALAAHASQLDAAALLQTFRASAVSTGYVEEFVRVHPPVARDVTAVEPDFFDPTLTGATDQGSAPTPPPRGR